jgi:hypothetical protein
MLDDCGGIVGKSSAEIRRAINEHIPDRYIPSRWEKIRARLPRPSLPRLTLPRYDLTIARPRFPKISWKFPDLGKYFDKFLEEWRNLIVGKYPTYDDSGIKTINETRSDMGLESLAWGQDAEPSGVPLHGKDHLVIIEVDGKQHTIDYVKDFNITMQNDGTQATVLGSDVVPGMLSGRPRTTLTMTVLLGSLGNINFWNNLLNVESKISIIDMANNQRQVFNGVGISMQTVGRADEYTTGKFTFMAKDFSVQEYETPAQALIKRLDEDYVYLNREHKLPCCGVELFEEVGEHAVCSGCGRLAVRNLPIPANVNANPYGRTKVKELADQINMTESLREKMSQYFTRGAIPVGVVVSEADEDGHVKVATDGVFSERIGLQVHAPAAHAKVSNLNWQYDEI